MLFSGSMWMTGLLAAVLLSLPLDVLAQNDGDTDSQSGSESVEDSGQASDGSAAAEPDERPADLDERPLDTPSGQSPGRFIPSEQISLDLGVSFPVDI